MKAFLIAAALCLSLVGAAQAKPVRHEQGDGGPAMTLDVPDGWGQQIDESGNLILTNGSTPSLAYSITLTENHDDLDKLAADSMVVAGAAPPRRAGEATLAGLNGALYYSTMETGGKSLGLKTIIVSTDDDHVASVTRVTFVSATDEEIAEADAMVRSIKFSPR